MYKKSIPLPKLKINLIQRLNYLTLLYGSVSQGLGTTKFTNLIG